MVKAFTAVVVCPVVVVVTAVMSVMSVMAGCAHTGRGTSPTFPALDAAARDHLATLSAGWVDGDPTTAARLSTGDVATRDMAAARTIAAQMQAGDTTDVAFDTISIVPHPLDAGASDFVAYEKVRFHSTGAATNLVELYHRDAVAAPWKAAYRAYFADNIDLPALRLDHDGRGHLLTAPEMTRQKAQPEDLAGRYAAAVTFPSPAQPGVGVATAFRPGQYTTGEVTDARNFTTIFADHGFGRRQWAASPGGGAVALVDGVLTLATVQKVQVIHEDAVGTVDYFVVQDAKRLDFGGLLAPGHYSDLTSVSSVGIGVVTGAGPPDVVGRDTQVLSIQGELARV